MSFNGNRRASLEHLSSNTQSSTQSQIQSLTQTQSLTKSSTRLSTKSSTQPLTKSSTRPLTKSSTQPSTKSSTHTSSKSSAQPSTESQIESHSTLLSQSHYTRTEVLLENVLFPMDLTSLLKEDSQTSIQANHIDSKCTSSIFFLAYDAINDPVLILSEQSLNVIHGNLKAIQAFGYKSFNETPLYKLFPDFNTDTKLKDEQHLKSQKGIHKKGVFLCYDISVGIFPQSQQSPDSKLWVLSLSKTHVPVSHSRYTQEFDELSLIGKGGFGKVFRVKNRVDQQEYAIKQVRINVNIEKLIASTNNNPTTIEGSEQSLLLFQHHQRILREVKMFASLSNHVNVVRYYNAWVESASNVTDSESDSEDDSRFDLIKSSPKKSQKKSLLNPERIKCEKQSFIYIQMQLCMLNDLRHWIDQRTTRLEGINTEKNLEILWQILCGLGHIHAQNIVHRDVKPENIFVDGSKILLGDFGLAKSIEHTAVTHKILQRHYVTDSSNDKGTYLYTAPEILSQTACTMKADIYSFGVLFLELFSVFSTGMERAKVLNSVKESGVLPDRFRETFVEEASLIEICILTEPIHRPSSSALIEDPIFHEMTCHTVSPMSFLGDAYSHSGNSYQSTLFHRRKSSSFSLTPFSPTSDIHIIPSNQSQAHQSHHNDSYLFLQDQNDLDDILSHQSPTLHHFDINDDDNDNDDDNNNHNDNDNYNDTTNHNHTSLSNSFQDKNHVYPARVDIYAPPTRRQSFPVNTVHPLTSNTIINNTHSSTMPSIEVFECDTHSEHHILRLERDVQVLMRKLEASVSRERELEDELERVIEIGSGSDDRDMSLFVNSEMNTSRPISIPKKKN